MAFFSGDWSTSIAEQSDPWFTPIMIVSANEFALAMFCVN